MVQRKGSIEERPFIASLSSSSKVLNTIAEALGTLAATSIKYSSMKSFGSIVLIKLGRSFRRKFNHHKILL